MTTDPAAALVAICGGLLLFGAILTSSKRRVYVTVSGSFALGVVIVIIVLAGSR